METNETHMREAMKLARQSAERGDYAIGAVIVKTTKS